MKPPLSLLSVFFAFLSPALQSRADVMTIYWKGVVTEADDQVTNSLPDEIEVGDEVNGTISFDDQNPYIYSESRFNIGDLEWQFLGLYVRGSVSPATLTFVYTPESGNWIQFPNAGNNVESSVGFYLTTPTSNPFSYLSAPNFDPDTVISGGGFAWTESNFLGTPTWGYRIGFDMTQVSLQPIPVPEPGAIALAGLATGCLLAARRRRAAVPPEHHNF